MAIFSMTMTALNRKITAKQAAGGGQRSAASAAAYVLALNIRNPRDGVLHQYSRKKGVFDTFTVGPDGQTFDPKILWPAVESHHKRGDAVPARLMMFALPHELTKAENLEFVKDFVSDFTRQYGVAASAGMHLPEKNGDQRNVHVHIIYTSCSVENGPELKLGNKVAALDSIAAKRANIENAGEVWKKKWEIAVNAALVKAGSNARIDCRTLVEQRNEAIANGDLKLAAELNREPTKHLGPSATAFERRTGQKSERRKYLESRGTTTATLLEIINKSIDAVKLEIKEIHRQLAATLREVLGLKESGSPSLDPAAENRARMALQLRAAASIEKHKASQPDPAVKIAADKRAEEIARFVEKLAKREEAGKSLVGVSDKGMLEQATRLGLVSAVATGLRIGLPVSEKCIESAAKAKNTDLLQMLKAGLEGFEIRAMLKSAKLDDETKKLLNEAIAIERPLTNQPPTGPKFN